MSLVMRAADEENAAVRDAAARIRVLGLLVLVLSAIAAPARADVVVNMQGSSAGGFTSDSLLITGEDFADDITITEGGDGGTGPVGEARDCAQSRLCFLFVESGTSRISPQGACDFAGGDRRVRCAYFGPGEAPESQSSRSASISLRGGSDRLRIVQRVSLAPDRALQWSWNADYGAGTDSIDGATVLTVPDAGPSPVTLAGGAGTDFFRGRFDTRPIRLFGDANGAVNVADADRFDNVTGGNGMRMNGEGGIDRFFLAGGVQLVDGGPGDDRIDAGTGIDNLAATIDGGAGTDVISYRDAPSGVRVVLDGTATSTGEDTLRNIENADGSRFGDRLIGTDGPNTLIGLGGRGDSLSGRGGDDVLDIDEEAAGFTVPSGQTDDAADGGAGQDLIQANDGFRDLVSCGSSTHTVRVTVAGRLQQIQVPDADSARLDLQDAEADCEDIRREPVRAAPAARIVGARVVGGRLRVTLSCAAGTPGGCRGRARLVALGTKASRPLGGGIAYRLRAGRRGTVRIALPPDKRRELASRGRALVRVQVAERDRRGRDRLQRRALLVRR
jgi:hypothetical protein